MHVNVVIGSYLEPELVDQIRSFDPELRVLYRPDLLPVPNYRCDHDGTVRALTDEQLAQWRATAAQADVFFDFDWLDPASMVENCPNLRWVQATSAGVGTLMRRTGLDNSPLLVTTAAGIHAVPLAEFALLGALYFVKDVPRLRAWQHDHHWERHTSSTLAGRRALVVGLGGIGRGVARTFGAQGVEVWGLGRRGHSYRVEGLVGVIEPEQLDETLAVTDLLVLACPLTAETRGLIGAAQIARLAAHAVVINLARGPVVDEEALLAALRTNAIAGACLDVFSDEPLDPGSPWWDLENVLVSPHSASTVDGENESLVRLFLDNLVRWRNGEPLFNRYDPVAGY